MGNPLDTINTYKSYFTKVQKASMKYNLQFNKEVLQTHKINATDDKGKQYTFSIHPIGGISDSHFLWYGDMNKILYKSLLSTNLSVFKKNTIKSLFDESKVPLKEKYSYVIPYLLSIMSPDYNVIETKTPDNGNTYFFLINLNIEDNHNYDKFIKKLNVPWCLTDTANVF